MFGASTREQHRVGAAPSFLNSLFCLFFAASAFTVSFANAQTVDEHKTCAAEKLSPVGSQEQEDSLQGVRLASVQESWRSIDVLLILPDEFFLHPDTGKPLFATVDEGIRNAQAAVALANADLKQIKVRLDVKSVRHFLDGENPFEQAALKRDAFALLQTAINSYNPLVDGKYDLRLILGRADYQGNIGLAYPKTSCLNNQYSVAFATVGGIGPNLEYGLGHTIAHEVGHYLGMLHDAQSYPAGLSIMTPRYLLHPAGFSALSLAQAAAHLNYGGNKCFDDFGPYPPGMFGDSDGDGVEDEAEKVKGSNFLDAGSYTEEIRSPAYALWNGFLDVVNILELINLEDSSVVVTTSLFSLGGELEYKKDLVLAPQGQFDLILNELPGFRQDAYGLVKLEFSGKIEGRSSFYRPRQGGNSFDFAFALPLRGPKYGESLVSFNTFSPAINSPQLQVAQWLTLVNLSESAQLFRLVSFEQFGAVLGNREVLVPPFGRLDIEAGHEMARNLRGPSNVGVIGQHRIVPLNPAAPYLAHLTRYGSQRTPANGFSFAVPILSRAGSGMEMGQQYWGLARENCWLEVNNALSRNTEVVARFFDRSGATVASHLLQLRPYGQRHLSIERMLSGKSGGFVQLQGNEPGALYADHLCYHFTSADELSAAYALALEEPGVGELSGSFNFFIGFDNILGFANPSDSVANLRVELRGPRGVRTLNYALAAKSSESLSLRLSEDFATWGDTYGVIRVFSLNQVPLHAGVLRLRSKQSNDGFDVLLPTVVR